MLWRLFWNPLWNETLYMVGCAENFLTSRDDERRAVTGDDKLFGPAQSSVVIKKHYRYSPCLFPVASRYAAILRSLFQRGKAAVNGFECSGSFYQPGLTRF
jgi:hypothetical protein